MGIIEHDDGRLEKTLELDSGKPIKMPRTNDPMELNEWRAGYLIDRGYKILGIIYPEEVSGARKKYSKFGNKVKFLVGAYYDNCKFHKDMRMILKRD